VVYVYSSNPSYSGFIRYSKECGPNFLSLEGQYSELAPCLTPLNEPGIIRGRYYEQPAGHWVVEMKIPLRGEGGIMTEPGQVVGMEIGVWGGADSYKDAGFYGSSLLVTYGYCHTYMYIRDRKFRVWVQLSQKEDLSGNSSPNYAPCGLMQTHGCERCSGFLFRRCERE